MPTPTTNDWIALGFVEREGRGCFAFERTVETPAGKVYIRIFDRYTPSMKWSGPYDVMVVDYRLPGWPARVEISEDVGWITEYVAGVIREAEATPRRPETHTDPGHTP